jgi:ribokinase
MPDRPHLVVIGSANMDLVVRTEHIPAPGETVLGGAFVMVPGGKGANQAVAASRLGARVQFINRVGKDAFGDALLAALTQAGIDTQTTLRDADHPTGVALIGVDAQGQNAIIVAPGANHQVSSADVEAARESIAAADAIVLQLEIPLETVTYAIALAREVGTRVILNPAPVRHTDPLPDALLRQVDVLTPNEHEAASLLGRASPHGMDWTWAAEQLRAKGVGTVLITLGAEGCLAASAEGSFHLPAQPVPVVDTTAAGDCFTGALAVALGEGKDLEAAARFASYAAALSVTRMGAQPSLPMRAEVEVFNPVV